MWVTETREMRTPCWIWQRSTNSRGYPCRRIDGKTVLVHRLHYEDMFGPLPAGYQIHHRCEERLCVNPEHLCARTQTEHAAEHHPAGESLPSFVLRMFQEQSEWSVDELKWPAHRAGHDRRNVSRALSVLLGRGEIVRVGYARYQRRAVAA